MARGIIMKNILTLGNMIKNDEIPIIEILVNNKVSGYLMPFRNYRFQICQDITGHSDLGSSPVMSPSFTETFKNIDEGNGFYPITRSLLEGQAMLAIYRYSQRMFRLANKPIIILPDYDESDKLIEFIRVCMTWIFREEDV